MIKQIIEIGKEKAYLSVKNRQLVIQYENEKSIQRPIEDIGVLILDHPSLTYSQVLLRSLIEFNVAVIITDDRHLPVGQLFPYASNTTQTERIRTQIEAKRPLNKQIWQDIIQRKIRNQAKLLNHLHNHDATLEIIARDVKSGDSSNREAYAGKLYWKYLFSELDFRRNRDRQDINMALNYGYMVLRAAIARSIAATGLHPSIGIHHRNKYNAFCLADDLIEPLRPMVDFIAVQLLDEYGPITSLSKEIRTRLLSVLNQEVIVQHQSFPLMEALNRYTASISSSYLAAENRLDIPLWSF